MTVNIFDIFNFQLFLQKVLSRSSHRRRYSVRKGVLRNFVKFTGKHLYKIFFNEVASLRPASLLKKGLCFPANFVKFLRTPFLRNTYGGWFYPSEMFDKI